MSMSIKNIAEEWARGRTAAECLEFLAAADAEATRHPRHLVATAPGAAAFGIRRLFFYAAASRVEQLHRADRLVAYNPGGPTQQVPHGTRIRTGVVGIAHRVTGRVWGVGSGAATVYWVESDGPNMTGCQRPAKADEGIIVGAGFTLVPPFPLYYDVSSCPEEAAREAALRNYYHFGWPAALYDCRDVAELGELRCAA